MAAEKPVAGISEKGTALAALVHQVHELPNRSRKSWMWVIAQAACAQKQTPIDVEQEVDARLTVVKEALHLQVQHKASHLQQIEMDPGCEATLRTKVRSLRRRRNQALHAGFQEELSGSSTSCTDEKQELKSDGACIMQLPIK